MTKDKALKLALKSLEKIYEGCGYVIEDKLHENAVTLAKLVREDCNKPITAIKEVLAQSEQEITLDQAIIGVTPHGTYKDWEKTQRKEQEPMEYTGNGTAGREADVRPTAFFFQMPKQEPVAWLSKGGKGIWFHEPDASLNATPLYTTPPQRTWVGLTEEEIMGMLDYGQYGKVPQYARNFVDAIEAKLREKNT